MKIDFEKDPLSHIFFQTCDLQNYEACLLEKYTSSDEMYNYLKKLINVPN